MQSKPAVGERPLAGTGILNTMPAIKTSTRACAKRRPSHAILWPGERIRAARRLLLTWYRTNARDLSWRRTKDPYAIWASEIMLQQTQVATVEKYFSRFLAAFPTVAALAAAKEDDVLRLWEGLGYYRRARQMHAAAKVLVAEHGGCFPSEFAAVHALPGIGRYTAGAILSIAFDSRLPVLEANTVRLLSRLLAYRGSAASSAGQRLLWRFAEELLPRRGSGDMNQALMELGSLLCTPREPHCGQCPLRSLCPTRKAGLQEEIPAVRPQPAMEDRHEAAVVVVHRGKVLLRKCDPKERWAGLWDFPRFLLRPSDSKSRGRKSAKIDARMFESQLVEGVRESTGVVIEKPRHIARFRHGVTRFRITLDCFCAQSKTIKHRNLDRAKLRLVDPDDLNDYPLSTTGRKLAQLWREIEID